jgi:hypothetical protein
MINPIQIYVSIAFLMFGGLVLVAIYREAAPPMKMWWKKFRINRAEIKRKKGAKVQTEEEFLFGWLTQMAEQFDIQPFDRNDLMSMRAAVQAVIKMLDEHERLR